MHKPTKKSIKEIHASASIINPALKLCKLDGLLKDSVNEENELGETKVFEVAAADWKPSHIKLLRLVLAGADIDEKNCKVNDRYYRGAPPLIKAAAAMSGRDAADRELALLGMNVDAADNWKKTALMTAANYGHIATMHVLGSMRTNLNATEGGGDTAIHWASRMGNTETLRALVSYKADVNVFSQRQRTPLW